MRVLISGASGLIGRRLSRALADDGHAVTRLVRRPPRATGEFAWDPRTGFEDPAALACDAVVHLAGESIGAGRWTTARKRRILESRVHGTRRLAEAIARADRPPRILVCASAVGFYGDRGDEVLTETSRSGGGFLAGVVREWEAAAEPAARGGARVVHLRQGLVLAREGGALPPLVTLFRAGLGGPVAGGAQWMSWIALDDLVDIATLALADPRLDGPVNAVAPGAVRQREFARALGRVLRRPAWFPLPGFALALVLGEMGRELLGFSQRVSPARLLEAGHAFRHADLTAALDAALAVPRA